MTLQSIARVDTLVSAMAVEVRLELTALGQSQAALAKALGVPAMWVSDRLTGRVQLTVTDAERMAGALGLKLSELIGRAERRLGSRSMVTQRYPSDPSELVSVGAAPVPALAAAIAHPLPASPIGQRRPTPLRSAIA